MTALLALRVHALLGNLDRVQALLKQLDVKYIQRHSLGYLNFGLGELFGRFRLSVFHYTNMSAFGDQNDREVSVCLPVNGFVSRKLVCFSTQGLSCAFQSAETELCIPICTCAGFRSRLPS